MIHKNIVIYVVTMTPDFTQTPCEIQKLKSKNKQKHFSPNFVLWTLQEEFGLYNQW